MSLLAIDPGNVESAFVVYAGDLPLAHGKFDNEQLVRLIAGRHNGMPEFGCCTHLAIEMAESFGAKVWQQVFTTVLWTGRFVQAWTMPSGAEYTLMSRLRVKTYVTGSARAKDPQVRQCLLERWGGKERAQGTRKQPGPLFGITADRWAALAIAVAWWDQHRRGATTEAA